MKHYRLKYAYWGWQEYWAAIAPKGNALEEFSQKLQLLSKCDDLILLNSGRAAIYIALRAFKDKKPYKNTVLMPSYTCNAVVDTVLEAGLKTRFVDVDDNLNMSLDSLRNQNFDDVLAVVSEHNYGYPADVAAISVLGKEHDFYVIDDAAQIQGVLHDGKPVGSAGDVGIYSFAQSKTLVGGRSGGGGVLLIQNDDLSQTCHHYAKAMPKSNSRLSSALKFIWHYQWVRYTDLVIYYFYRIFGERKSSPFQMSLMNSFNAAILLTQFSRLDWIIDGKKKVISAYIRIRSEFPELEFVQNLEGKYATKLMVRLPQGYRPQQTQSALQTQGIQSRLSYIMPWTNDNPDCRNAEKFAETIIELPIIIGMGDDDVRDILGKFQKVTGR